MMCQKHENTLIDDEISKNSNENLFDINDVTSSDNAEFSNDESDENNADNSKLRNIGFYVNLIPILVVAIVALAFSVIAVRNGLGNGLSNSKLQKLLEENGYYDYGSAKVETVLDLNDNVNGLADGDKNKLVLLNNDGYYGYVVINTKTNKLDIPTFGYIPLNVVQQEIWSMGKDINIKNASILKKYIEQYGINGLENKEYAEGYLREITGTDGIIATAIAQDVISNSTMKMFSSIKSNDEVIVLFENNSAVPLYYTMQSSEMVYNWSSLWPEYQYEFVKASLDRNTLSRIAAMYGPPYIAKTVWAVVDSDLKEVGTFNSLESAKAALLSKNKTNANTLSNEKDTSNQSAKNEQKTDDIGLRFTDYSNNTMLTGKDISSVRTEYDDNKNQYYIELTFTAQERKKFKKATADIAKLSSPNNKLDIKLDGCVISSPSVSEEIDSDSCIISGDFSKENAESLAKQIEDAMQ